MLVRDLPALPPASLRLVVLSACDTAGSARTGSEGVQTLLLPFLAMGVPTIVASLWPVDDELSSELMTAFHREVAAGADPAAALRTAKLASLHHLDPRRRAPSVWAPFILIGGVAGDAQTTTRQGGDRCGS
jgi:CHAT domain-containing protein